MRPGHRQETGSDTANRVLEACGTMRVALLYDPVRFQCFVNALFFFQAREEQNAEAARVTYLPVNRRL